MTNWRSDAEVSLHYFVPTFTSGLKVSEVAHDHQVKKYVVEDLHVKNSSDTWHGNS